MIRLLRVFVPMGSLPLLISELILVPSAFLLGAYLTLEYDPEIFLLYDYGIYKILVVTVSIIAGLHFHGLYDSIFVKSRTLLLQQLSLVMGLAFMAMGLISFASSDLRMPLRLMVAGSAIATATIFSWRILYAKYALAVVGAQRLLLVGANPVVEAIAEHLIEHPELGMKVIGYIDDGVAPGSPRKGGKVLGSSADLREIAAQVNPHRIVAARGESGHPMPVAGLLELRFAGTNVEDAGSAYESVCMRVSLRELRPAQMILARDTSSQNILLLQTVYNLGLGAIGIVLFLPLMLLLAVGIKLTSGGPVLVRRQYIGLNGRQFPLYRFRCAGAMGGFLRRFRLEELPQLFNLLRGDVAIAGPQPVRPEFVAALSALVPFYGQRHRVKPGITGWAQINSPPKGDLPNALTELEYDLYYLKNVSVSLDAYIILHALRRLFLPRAAD